MFCDRFVAGFQQVFGVLLVLFEVCRDLEIGLRLFPDLWRDAGNENHCAAYPLPVLLGII